MIIKDKQGNKWTVLAIENDWYHLYDEVGNISIVNNRNIEVAFKVASDE